MGARGSPSFPCLLASKAGLGEAPVLTDYKWRRKEPPYEGAYDGLMVGLGDYSGVLQP